MELRPVPLRQDRRDAWDAGVALANGSFQVCFDHLRAQALRTKGRARTHLVTLHLGDSLIGQCAVEQRGQSFSIQDGLLLAPDAAEHWTEAMLALLRRFGPGRYSYGGLWSCEPPREDMLAAIGGVSVTHARPFFVQGVDFSKWPSWDRYWAKVSDSVRYESKHAPARVPGLRLVHYTGRDMLKAIRPIVELQRASYGRKDLEFSRVKQGLRYAFYMALCWRSLSVVLAEADEGVLAAFYGSQIGPNMYYVYGGQKAGSGGANWFLLKEMTRAAFEAAPTGRFVMGNVDYAVHDEAVGGGLLRARRALRVSEFPTSMVDFSYQPAA